METSDYVKWYGLLFRIPLNQVICWRLHIYWYVLRISIKSLTKLITVLCCLNNPIVWWHLDIWLRQFILFHLSEFVHESCVKKGVFRKQPRKIYWKDIIPPHWHGTGIWNPYSWKTRACLFHIANVMAANDMATQGARASAVVLLS